MGEIVPKYFNKIRYLDYETIIKWSNKVLQINLTENDLKVLSENKHTNDALRTVACEKVLRNRIESWVLHEHLLERRDPAI